MHTDKKTAPEILDFASFIKEYFPAFQIDGNNATVIANLGLWATRNPKFNGKEDGWHIDRGILLFGPVGVGKDELFRLLRSYLSYLRSPYGYGFKVVWEFARPFQKDGYECFQEDAGNIYYEELGLTDEHTNQPTREFVNHFGTKILIGAEIINLRYKIFKNTAWQTHFSTNLNETQLAETYGSRCMSRLYEMCNIIAVTGKDRRGQVIPEFKTNKNNPGVPLAREASVDEKKENIASMEQHYQDFLAGKEPTTNLSLVYVMLVAYGVQVATDEELRMFMEQAAERYAGDDPSLVRKTVRDREEAKRVKIWEVGRRDAVIMFFQRMKAGGRVSIFGETEVRLGLIAEDKRIALDGKSVGDVISAPGTLNGASQETFNQG